MNRERDRKKNSLNDPATKRQLLMVFALVCVLFSNQQEDVYSHIWFILALISLGLVVLKD